MKKFHFLLLLAFVFQYAAAQVPEKASPFTAVKWEGETPIVRVENEWYTLKQLDGVDASKIISYCKKQYGDRWQKRFSEDLVEVMKGMGQTPQTNAKLTLVKDKATVQKTAAMTKENRQAVWKYNNAAKSDSSAVVSNPNVKAPEKKETPASTNAVIKAPSGSFKIKACKITYEYSGIITGTDVFYFDDYGKVAVLEQNRKEFGSTTKKTLIWKDGKTLIVDHDKKEAVKSPFRPKDTEPPTIAYVSEQQRKTSYEKLENETIAGKSCEVYNGTAVKAKYWLWNDIDLRLENYALGKMGYTKNAVKVEEISAIPAELLVAPEGYKTK
ncbi:MAG: hypothetical protein IAF38_14015 [Bacteroidia bacterium]|nr:hypothetical protein [Bacteroidia bacterium]